MAVAAPGQLNLDESPSWGSRGVDCFEKLEQIGEGTYGQVLIFTEFPLIFLIDALRFRFNRLLVVFFWGNKCSLCFLRVRISKYIICIYYNKPCSVLILIKGGGLVLGL